MALETKKENAGESQLFSGSSMTKQTNIYSILINSYIFISKWSKFRIKLLSAQFCATMLAYSSTAFII